jgi:hypothetical protein
MEGMIIHYDRTKLYKRSLANFPMTIQDQFDIMHSEPYKGLVKTSVIHYL